YVSRSTLKSILLLTGSQCREASTGEMCSYFVVLVSVRAAEFCISWRLFIEYLCVGVGGWVGGWGGGCGWGGGVGVRDVCGGCVVLWWCVGGCCVVCVCLCVCVCVYVCVCVCELCV